MKDFILLDTHVLLWSLLEPEELSKDVKKQITIAQNNNRLLIASISLWEIAMLSAKQRIHIYEPVKDFLKSITSIGGLTFVDINPGIAAETIALGDFHGDPADRIIVAAAKVKGAKLFTRDKKILDWAKSGYVNFVKA